jgi:hypothetical protein
MIIGARQREWQGDWGKYGARAGRTGSILLVPLYAKVEAGNSKYVFFS